MPVERRQRRAARSDARHTFERREQRLQFRLHFEHDLGPGARQQRDVACKLDGVAKALLGMQQNRFSRQRIVAEPQRPAVFALRRHAGAAPAPFVLRKAAAEIADGEQRQRLIEMGVGIILVDGERLAVARDRLLVAIERGERAAAIVPGPRVIGRERERGVTGSDGVGVAAQAEQRDAAIVVRHRVSRIDRERRIEIGDGLVERPSWASVAPRLTRASL